MKYCVKCGKENLDENKYCVGCGNNIEYDQNKEMTNFEFKHNEEEKVTVVQVKEVNSLASLSFLLGIISIGCLIMPIGLPFGIVISLFAISTGIVSLIRKPRINMKKAVLGIVFGIIVLLISIMMFIIIEPLLEYIKNFLSNYCLNNPENEECLFIGEMFPNLFE